MSFIKFLLAVSLTMTALEANAMWKLIEMVARHEVRAQPPTLSWDEALLEAQDLEGFLQEAERRGINPNLSMSRSQETALTLACKKDMTGEIVKKLLALGCIAKNIWETDEAIWSPLYYAVKAGNTKAIDLIFACEALPLSEKEIIFATEPAQ